MRSKPRTASRAKKRDRSLASAGEVEAGPGPSWARRTARRSRWVLMIHEISATQAKAKTPAGKIQAGQPKGRILARLVAGLAVAAVAAASGGGGGEGATGTASAPGRQSRLEGQQQRSRGRIPH